MTVSTERPVAAPLPVQSGSIVVSSDGSRASLSAVRWACQVADAVGARVTVVGAPRREKDTARDDVTSHDRRLAERLGRQFDDRGVQVDDVMVGPGPLDAVLARHAEAADLVVLGIGQPERAHLDGHDGLIARLARRSPCPIVVVPTGDWAESATPVIVGVNGSDGNRAVFGWAQWFARQLGRPLVAVHVVDPIHRTFDPVNLSDEEVAVRHEIEHSGAEFVERVDTDPARSMAAYASSRNASLLVVGARDRNSLGGRFLGGVASGLACEIARPVVVVPRTYQLRHRRP